MGPVSPQQTIRKMTRPVATWAAGSPGLRRAGRRHFPFTEIALSLLSNALRVPCCLFKILVNQAVSVGKGRSTCEPLPTSVPAMPAAGEAGVASEPFQAQLSRGPGAVLSWPSGTGTEAARAPGRAAGDAQRWVGSGEWGYLSVAFTQVIPGPHECPYTPRCGYEHSPCSS